MQELEEEEGKEEMEKKKKREGEKEIGTVGGEERERKENWARK